MVIFAVFGGVEVFGESIAAFEEVVSAEDVKIPANLELFSCKEVFSVGLAWLVEGEFLGKFLSFEGDWERVFT